MRQTTAPPAGIIILAVLAATFGLFILLLGLFLVITTAPTSSSSALSTLFFQIGLFVTAFGVLQMTFACGIGLLKPWGWVLGVAIQVGIIILAILFAIPALGSTTTCMISGGMIVVAAGVLYYLFTPQTRSLFRRG